MQIRLAALGLLCESPRSTESISELDLQLLKTFVPANMNNQSPSFRQQAAAQVKKVSSFWIHNYYFTRLLTTLVSLKGCLIIPWTVR